MNRQLGRRGAFVALLAFVLSASLQASEKLITTLTIPAMNCGGCAKKVATKLRTIANVAEVTTDVKAKSVKITPVANKTVSARELWEAAEAVGQKPNKLDGPEGIFEAKPQT